MIKSETVLLFVVVIMAGFSLQHYVLGDTSYDDGHGYLQKMGGGYDTNPSNNPNSMIHQPLPGTAPTPTVGGISSTSPSNACNQPEYAQAQAVLASAEQSYLNLKSTYYQNWKQLNASGKYNDTWSDYAKNNFLKSNDVDKIRQIHEQYGGLVQYCYPAPQAGGSSSIPVQTTTYGGTVGSQSNPPVNGTTSANTTNTKDILMEVEQPTPIPSWIKSNARFWATDQIGDSDFVSGLQYLVTIKIIHLTQPLTTNDTSSTSMPLWIKGLAGSWADGKISNDYFASTLQFMVNQNIIKL